MIVKERKEAKKKNEVLFTSLVIVLLVLIAGAVILGLTTCKKQEPAGVTTETGETKAEEDEAESYTILTGVELKPGETPVILLPDANGESGSSKTPSSSETPASSGKKTSSTTKPKNSEPKSSGSSGKTTTKNSTEPEPTQPAASTTIPVPTWTGPVETPIIPIKPQS